MSADRGYVLKNDAERARLEALVAARSDTDLSRPMPTGWDGGRCARPVSPRKAAELTVAIAEVVDKRVAAMSDDLVARNAGSPLNLDRAVHRREHLDEIERVLSP